jgi:hypothetical protein
MTFAPLGTSRRELARARGEVEHPAARAVEPLDDPRDRFGG